MKLQKKQEVKMPKVEIDIISLSDNVFKRDNKMWNVSNLIQYAKEQGYPVFKLPLVAIDLSYMPWPVNTMNEMLFHCKRIMDCSIDYPILLDDMGGLCDGTHRVLKAILEGKTEIDAIRLQKMPSFDYSITDNK